MWPCFLIEEHEKRVEAIVGHGKAGTPESHRSVVEVFRGMDFDDHPEFEDYDWPHACPRCGAKLDYEGEWETGWRTFMGTASWRNPQTGEVKDNQHDFGPGAMYEVGYMEWLKERTPDGKVWAVVLPPAGQADYWVIDDKASSGGYWTRTGTPPNLSVTPSILTPNYHGFLTNGVLTDSLPDRPL